MSMMFPVILKGRIKSEPFFRESVIINTLLDIFVSCFSEIGINAIKINPNKVNKVLLKSRLVVFNFNASIINFISNGELDFSLEENVLVIKYRVSFLRIYILVISLCFLHFLFNYNLEGYSFIFDYCVISFFLICSISLFTMIVLRKYFKKIANQALNADG